MANRLLEGEWQPTMGITEDQSDVIAFLSSPSAHGGAAVERIETHASIVFLAGTHAWKLKRAVRYDYLDFSTSARRVSRRSPCVVRRRLVSASTSAHEAALRMPRPS